MSDTDKVLSMLTRNDIDIFGRMPTGFDESDFDILPTHTEYMDEAIVAVAQGKAMLDSIDEEPAEMFEPAESSPDADFPILGAALRRVGDSKARLMRVDTPESYGRFLSDQAVSEIVRRIDDLKAAFEAHASDPLAHPHAHEAGRMVSADILGAAEAVAKISSAKSPSEAARALPRVPLKLPGFANGKVDCWRDGERVICSVRFLAADGSKRIATMSAVPRYDEEEVAGEAIRRGMNPIVVLGALPDAAASACGQRLAKEIAGAALACAVRGDVCGMDEDPLLLVARGVDAPTAALTELEQRAQAGEPAAVAERARVERAAKTPMGRRFIAPALNRAKAKAKAAKKPTFADRYSSMIALLA